MRGPRRSTRECRRRQARRGPRSACGGHDHLCERRLARPFAPDDVVYLALLHGDAHAVDHHGAVPVAVGNVLYEDQWLAELFFGALKGR